MKIKKKYKQIKPLLDDIVIIFTIFSIIIELIKVVKPYFSIFLGNIGFKEDNSILKDLIEASIYQHFLRLIFYSSIMFLSHTLLQQIRKGIHYYRNKIKRKKIFNSFIKSQNKEMSYLNNFERQIQKGYLKGGIGVLKKFILLSNDPDKKRKIIRSNNGIYVELIAIELIDSIKEDKGKAIKFSKSLIKFITV